MTIEVALLISIVSVGFAVYSGIENRKRNEKNDNKKEATDMTTVIVKLETINTGITEIKTELSSVKNDTKEDRERIIKCEESVKSAWKRIDILEGNRKGEADG
jgi:peptidoglycan hydrolase CwlO-like protein